MKGAAATARGRAAIACCPDTCETESAADSLPFMPIHSRDLIRELEVLARDGDDGEEDGPQAPTRTAAQRLLSLFTWGREDAEDAESESDSGDEEFVDAEEGDDSRTDRP